MRGASASAAVGVWLMIQPACSFPDVGLRANDGGASSSSTVGQTSPSLASTGTDQGGGTAASTTSSASSGGGQGGTTSTSTSTGEGGLGGEGGMGTSVSTGGTCVSQNCSDLCVDFPGACVGGGGDGGGTGGSGGSGPILDCDGDGAPNEGEPAVVDCHPCNGNVHPSQTTFFGTAYDCHPTRHSSETCTMPEVGSSFDYDCNGVEEYEEPITFNASPCVNANTCNPKYIVSGSAGCGQTVSVQACKKAEGLCGGILGPCCEPIGAPTPLLMRCR